MIPLEFEYEAPDTLEGAIALLSGGDEDVKVLAGGHSLIPLMKLRLAAPSLLVDIRKVPDLRGITRSNGDVRIGALTTHAEVEGGDIGLTSLVAGTIADPQVRHRGTIGGSLAHGDPASDLPAVLLATGASLVIRGQDGERTVAADDFFQGFLETAVGPDELLTEIRVPRMPDAGWSFQKFNRRAQDWAIVGVACVRQNGSAGIGLVNMGSQPIHATAAEQAIASGASVVDAAAVADEGTDPPADLNASVEYRRHLARVLTRRALEAATS
jgi:carbon-monoxide dehydrogenase medium subunit